jgi:hypothetical protein
LILSSILILFLDPPVVNYMSPAPRDKVVLGPRLGERRTPAAWLD